MSFPPPAHAASALASAPNKSPSQRLRDDHPIFLELESVMRHYWDQNQDKVKTGTFAWPAPKKFYKDFEARFKAWCGTTDNKTWTDKARNAITRIKDRNPGWKLGRKKGKFARISFFCALI